MNLTGPSTPHDMCVGENESKTLVIPIYQRLFVWGEEQINNLLRDLYTSLQQDKDKDYHLGVITVHEDKDKPNHLEIVDGQQRLTFLTLLGCEMIRRGKCGDANWKSFIWLNYSEKQLRLFFTGREEDRKDIQRLLGMEVDETNDVANAAFVRFSECFKRFALAMPDEELKKFSEYCFSHAAFLTNELPAGYGAEELNLYFEKMNSTGRQLSPLEVVKGKWFSPLAARWNRCMNFDVEFMPEQVSIVETEGEKGLNLTDVVEGNEKYKRIRDAGKIIESDKTPKDRLLMRPDILALHALVCLYKTKEQQPKPTIQRNRLIETFRKALEEDHFSAEEYLTELENYRYWVDKHIVFLEDLEGDLDYAFRVNADVDEKDKDLMKQFQSMLYVSSGENQEWILKAYLESDRGQLSYESLRRMESRWHEEDSLDPTCLIYGRILRYWFWKLDYLLWELHLRDRGNTIFSSLDQPAHDAIHKYRFRDNRSIEHLYPQSQGNANWGTRNDHSAPMHRFGNLAMMSIEGNSSQQDDPIQVKFGRVKAWLESGRLESIKMLLMFYCADTKAEGWTPLVAEDHEKEMLSLLKEDIKRFRQDQ